jgi:hypothetical protein
MRFVYGLIFLICATAAYAKPANTECVASDGSRFFMVASNGKVMIQWEDGNWNDAFAKVEDKMVMVTQIAPNGVIVVAWNTVTNAAYVVMKNDKTGRKDEYHARCWFK